MINRFNTMCCIQETENDQFEMSKSEILSFLNLFMFNFFNHFLDEHFRSIHFQITHLKNKIFGN